MDHFTKPKTVDESDLTGIGSNESSNDDLIHPAPHGDTRSSKDGEQSDAPEAVP